MGIYDLGYGGFGAFQNNYRISDIPRVDVNKPVTPVEEVKEAVQSPKIEIEEINKAPRSTDPNSVSLEFNKGNDYSYIGSTKNIEKLDVAKAISDMQQDSILQEYNYFVGSGANVFSSEDGTVIAK
ncbi:MAG: hypothetical protein K5868_11020 [Lachnospiraceae bacterium]|nr:hypothetical protein [Lachnospiraceae bacterium]